MKDVRHIHKKCYCEWLTKHCYDFPDNLPISCHNHDENYLRWVRFRAREIHRSENGTMPFQPWELTDSTKVPRKSSGAIGLWELRRIMA